MDAYIYLTLFLGVGGFIGSFLWILRQWRSDNDKRLENDIKRISEANEIQQVINEIQANPFPDAKSANSWLQKLRNRNK